MTIKIKISKPKPTLTLNERVLDDLLTPALTKAAKTTRATTLKFGDEIVPLSLTTVDFGKKLDKLFPALVKRSTGQASMRVIDDFVSGFRKTYREMNRTLNLIEKQMRNMRPADLTDSHMQNLIELRKRVQNLKQVQERLVKFREPIGGSVGRKKSTLAKRELKTITAMERKANDLVMKSSGPGTEIGRRMAAFDQQISKNVVDPLARTETMDALKATQIINKADGALDKTLVDAFKPAMDDLDAGNATTLMQFTPSRSATPTALTIQNTKKILKFPNLLKLDKDTKKKLIKVLAAAGLLAGLGSTVLYFLNNDSISPEADAEPVKKADEPAPTEPEVAPEKPVKKSRFIGGDAAAQNRIRKSKRGKDEEELDLTMRQAIANIKGCGKSTFKALDVKGKLDCALKNKKWVDIARAYMQTRDLFRNEIRKVLSTPQFQAAQKDPSFKSRDLIQGTLQGILPIPGYIVRRGLKDLTVKDAKQMYDVMYKFQNDSKFEKYVEIVIPSEYNKFFTKKSGDKMPNLPAGSEVLDLTSLTDYRLDRESMVELMDFALGRNVKPWISNSAARVADYNKKKGKRYAATSKLKRENINEGDNTKEEKCYDLDFFRWKNML